MMKNPPSPPSDGEMGLILNFALRSSFDHFQAELFADQLRCCFVFSTT